MDNTLFMIRLAAVLYGVFVLAIGVLVGYIVFLIIKALRKYINSQETREQKQIVKKSLGELLKENRIRCKMTQEFVSEALGVSRQAVSKWENGITDPSTSNLMAIAHLYGISAEELLRSVNADLSDSQKNPMPEEKSENDGK